MRLNVDEQTPLRTHEGGAAVSLTPEQQLRRTVMANLLWEDTFYENGQDSAVRIKELVPKVGFETAAQIALEAREQMKMRHVPLLIARWCLGNYDGKKVGDLIARVIQRPDEAGELLAIYRATGGKSEPKQLRHGISRALLKFDEYQLAKYKGAGSGFSLRDVVFLTHVKPPTPEHGSMFARLVNKEFIPDAVCKQYPELDPTGVGLKSPETWENRLSRGEDKAAVFGGMVAAKKLGAMAMLRNLRNMVQTGVPDDLIRQGINEMKAERVLPFRFISAAKHAPRFEPELEQAMVKCIAESPKLPGRTVLAVDVSGSMYSAIAGKSELLRVDTAAGLAILLREVCEEVRILVFGDRVAELAPRRGFALRDLVTSAPVMVGHSTNLGGAVEVAGHHKYDRLIVITDEQSHDSVPAPKGLGYMVNVAAYQNGVGYGPWVRIDGWSEAIVTYIQAWEAGSASHRRAA